MDVINNMLTGIDNDDDKNIKSSQYIKHSFNKWINAIVSINVNQWSSWNEYIVSWFCLFNNNVVQFHKINEIFRKVKHIRYHWVGDADDLYFDSLLSMIQKINLLKYSVLKQIQLLNINIKCSSDSFCKYTIQYQNNGWKLEQFKEGVINITR